MSVSSWLAARHPAAPAVLTERISSAMDALDLRVTGTDDRLLSAAEALLAHLLREGCATRSAAHELLAADALVTYAFEATAEEQPSRLEACAATAMQRIAALAQEPNA